MDKIICRECQKEFSGIGGLHTHLRSHKMSQKDYYQTHHPRYDLLTKEVIVFKDRETYLSTNFNSRKNFSQWLRTSPTPKIKKYLEDRIQNLYREREPNHIISSSELETLKEPSINIYNQHLDGGYYEYCSQFVKVAKYEKPSNLDDFETIPDDQILIDKREQNPFKFSPQNIVLLKFGDYANKKESESGRVRVERKSSNDFVSTMTSGEERFSREIKRASRNGYEIVVVVEAIVHKLLHQSYNKFSKANPQFYFHNMRKLCQEYDNVQFVFCNGRKKAKEVCRFVLANGNRLKNLDIHRLISHYDLLPS